MRRAAGALVVALALAGAAPADALPGDRMPLDARYAFVNRGLEFDPTGNDWEDFHVWADALYCEQQARASWRCPLLAKLPTASRGPARWCLYRVTVRTFMRAGRAAQPWAASWPTLDRCTITNPWRTHRHDPV